jgi:ubiquinone biosynthesis protein COQ4
MHALLEDPDDTAQAFRVIAALSGDSGLRLFRRFRRSPTGRRILREKRTLIDFIGDTDKLRAMPPGSVGRALADFYSTEQLSAQALVAASEAGLGDGAARQVDDDRLLFSARLRDLHDVFHVMTGYGRDLYGEAAVLAFTLAQTRNPGIGFIILTILYRAGIRSEVGRLIRQGFRRGLRSQWLVDLDWEALLPQPIERLRETFRIGPPPLYEPVRSAGAPSVP